MNFFEVFVLLLLAELEDSLQAKKVTAMMIINKCLIKSILILLFHL